MSGGNAMPKEVIVVAVSVCILVAGIAGLVYVAIHFISKYW
jgi:hypothetical protein